MVPVVDHTDVLLLPMIEELLDTHFPLVLDLPTLKRNSAGEALNRLFNWLLML